MELPENWHTAKIAELLTLNENGKPFQQGWSPQCESYPADEDKWGVLKTTAIQQGAFLEQENKALPKNLSPKTHLEVKVGDVLMTCAGPRNRCGVVCFIKSTRDKLLMSGKMYRFRPNIKILNPQYLEAFITSHDAQKSIDQMKTGINDSGLNLTHARFSELVVPLAPLNEQHRIVAKIEELFSELDQGIDNLKTAQAQLKVYRQALLKHAFEGKLTAEWRAQNADKLESASALQQRIQHAREQRYEQQLAEWQDNGKQGSKPKAPKPITPLTAEELAELPELPDGWGWVKYIELVESSQNGISKRSGTNGQEVVVLRLADITEQKVSVKSTRKIVLTEVELSNYRLNKADLLCIRVNGSPDLVGRMVNIENDSDIAYCDHFIRYRLLHIVCNSKFISNFFNTVEVRRHIDINKVSSAGQNTVNQEMLGAMVVPFCSKEEQDEVVYSLEEKISEIDQLDQTITTSLQQAEALRQSILKKAFSGELVPQDPNDEPASVLLARIKAEKGKQNAIR